MWCDHKKGCDDAGDFGSKMYPYHGCQTMQLPKEVEPQNWDRGPMFSSFQSGYITGNDSIKETHTWQSDGVCCSSSPPAITLRHAQDVGISSACW